MIRIVLLSVFVMNINLLLCQNHYEFIAQFQYSNSSKKAISINRNPLIKWRIKEQLSISMHIALIEVESDLDRNSTLEQLSKYPEIASVQPNAKVHLRNVLPNDQFFADQWNLLNTGQLSGKPGADIAASKAWIVKHPLTTLKGDTIVVAVIDDRVDTNIKQVNWWVNRNETPHNGIDDDGNGYIDDYRGWNTILDNDDVQALSGEYHATHMSGIIGAKGNDTLGTAGIHWGVKVMPVVGADISDVANVIQAYSYIIDQKKIYLQTNGLKGAYIIATNSSFGIDNEFGTAYPIWCAMYDSMGKYGILSSAATTNASSDIDIVGDMPTTCASNFLFSVTSSNFLDKHSNRGYGKINIDLHAPGEGIYSTMPGGVYASRSGCSQAAPHVAGVLSFLFAMANDSLISDYNKNLEKGALEFRKAIMRGLDTLPQLASYSCSGGRLNMYRSLLEIDQYKSKKTPILNIDKNNLPVFKMHFDGSVLWLWNIENSVEVKLYNVSGQLMQQLFTSSPLSLELQQFQRGLYLIKIVDEWGNSKVEKLILE